MIVFALFALKESLLTCKARAHENEFWANGTTVSLHMVLNKQILKAKKYEEKTIRTAWYPTLTRTLTISCFFNTVWHAKCTRGDFLFLCNCMITNRLILSTPTGSQPKLPLYSWFWSFGAFIDRNDGQKQEIQELGSDMQQMVWQAGAQFSG